MHLLYLVIVINVLFVLIIHTHFRNIVNKVTNDDKKDQTQQCLQNLQKRITNKLDCLRGPDNKLDYKQLESETKSTEELLSTINSQLLQVENELEEEKSLLKADEEQEKQYDNNSYDQNIQGIIPATSLNLTKLSKESLDRPIPKIPNDLGKAAKKLQSALATKKQELEQAGFTRWVASLSQVISQVNSS
ncbi:uncharacterized protein LOC110231628 [Exaiptasia diaphana]|uniref:Uncharacterized protein n=1 Tax=Exaiptasia diaphana TaxID=2652724 RepID=A0A913WPX2_EXADI|nr:uncharacterized protein LOC110231628 [Exaiptasia diaphana]